MDLWSLLTNNSTSYTNELGVQNMEIKLEPIDPDETTEPLEIVETMHNHANNANVKGNTHTNGSSEVRYRRERDMDNMLFDFGLDSLYGNGEIGNSLNTTTSNELASLSAEDQYYLSLIKFEDSIVYICPACGEEFRAQEVWKRHLNTVHNYNTRHGLNFIQLDKLYHKCLECNKRIAMHSMENLLKHKFTHLPFRCSKCNVCKRQYKYRQDLMVHIRLIHRDELLAEVKNGIEGKHKRHKPNQSSETHNNNVKKKAGLAIGDVKENAYDIFENSCDNVEIKNEFIDPNDPYDDAIAAKRRLSDGMATIPPVSSSFVEDGTIGQSDWNDVDATLEEYILFNCPQCSLECENQSEWRHHINFVHDFGTRKGLNFQDTNMKQQLAQCLECHQVVTPSTISNLQSHKFSHLSDKEWLKCKLCFSPFGGNKQIIEHLAEKHRLYADNNRYPATANTIMENADDESHDMNYDFSGFDDYDNSAGAADTKLLLSGHDIYTSQTEDYEKYEKHIDYICPKCGREYADKKRWRKHLVNAHQLADFDKLNFDIIKDRQLKCRECKKVIPNAYDLQNAQQHSITHMKYNGFARCRLCLKSYTDRKTLYKHLRHSHSVNIASGASKPSLSPKSTADATHSGNSMKGKVIAVSKQREIVQFGDCIYEIYYLDEDDNSSSNVVGISAKDDEDFDEECSEYIFNKSLQQAHCHKCVSCGAIFSTHPALLFHIKNEHGSLTTNNSSNTSRQNSDLVNEDLSNDDACDDLLVPTGVDIDLQPEETVNLDCNFIYLCPQCGEEFRIQSLWRRHINTEHNFDKRDFLDFRCIDKFHYQCNVCKDIVQSSKLKGLQDHKFRHCPYKLYLKCLLCGTCYNHKPNMLSHLRQRHNITDYQECTSTANNIENTNSKHIKPINDHSNGSSSNSGFRSGALPTVEDVISFHNAVDHDSITYHCPSCYENFTSHTSWRKHIVDVHKLNSREGLNFRKLDAHHYVCLQCHKRVTVTHTKGAIGQLQSHKFRHLPYKSFRCTVCQAQFVRKQMFFKHLDRNTNKCSGYSDDFYPENNDRSYRDQYDDDFDLSGALVQRNSGDVDNMDAGLWSSRYSLQSGSNDSSTDRQDCYTVNCPQCGAHFESVRAWREHISSEHNLNTVSALNLKKISTRLHQCLQCHEYMHDSSLYELQVHRFKHLPYGAYIHCRYCRMACYHFSRMEEHLKRKHPQMLRKSSDDMVGGYYNADDNDEGELGETIDLDLDLDANDEEEDPDGDEENDGEMDAIDADSYAQADNAVDGDADNDANAAEAKVDGDEDEDVIADSTDAVDIAANNDAEVDEDDVIDGDADVDTENAAIIHADADADADVEPNDGLDADDNSSSDVVDLVEVEADIEDVDPEAADSDEQYLLG